MTKVLKSVYIALFVLLTQQANAVTVENSICGLVKQSQELAQIIIKSKGQKRKSLNCNINLAKAAAKKAKQMAESERIAHTLNNLTANEHLAKFGIELPHTYEILGNQVEAVLGGEQYPQEAFSYFMTSTDHKSHLLGENSFFRDQDQIGVGFYYDEAKKYEYYWVVYITSLKKDSDPVNGPYHVKFVFEKPKKKRERFKRGDTISRRVYKK